MSETKFTPGPWFANGHEVLAPDDGDEDPWSVALASPCRGYPNDQSRANARLIAAAPEMYEALDFLSAHARERVSDAPEWRDDDTVQIVVTIGDLRRARAALAKARGDQ